MTDCTSWGDCYEKGPIAAHLEFLPKFLVRLLFFLALFEILHTFPA